jgi:uncharacterized membrane protein
MLAWFSLASIALALVIGVSPYLLLLLFGEESEEGAALGWVFIFLALPVGLVLITVAVILILIAGIRGLANGRSRLFGILAIAGACGSAVSALVVIVLTVSNLMEDYAAPTTSPIPLALFTAALLILGLVSTFVLAFSSSARIPGSENSPVDA